VDRNTKCHTFLPFSNRLRNLLPSHCNYRSGGVDTWSHHVLSHWWLVGMELIETLSSRVSACKLYRYSRYSLVGQFCRFHTRPRTANTAVLLQLRPVRLASLVRPCFTRTQSNDTGAVHSVRPTTEPPRLRRHLFITATGHLLHCWPCPAYTARELNQTSRLSLSAHCMHARSPTQPATAAAG